MKTDAPAVIVGGCGIAYHLADTGWKVMTRRCLLAAIVAGWVLLSLFSSYAAPAIPGPLGGPEIAVDVNTMIGKKAPSSTLRDGDGKSYRVVPGRGRPLVVISHMGYT